MRLNFWVADEDAPSVTWTVKVEVPAAVGVSMSPPVAVKVSPLGSELEASDQVYGGVPPVARSVREYVVPTVPCGSGDVVAIASETSLVNWG